ncbi:GNAT family protein [Aliterella atlantica]|uniref:N-acetyltransferase n=1 Tax=Aliterella atlantica TaxID=1827278 RepID=UPI0006982424|nr:N-acetyltransferase [Aliterella atlantica]
MFSVVNQANSVVHRDLQQWSQIATASVNQAIENDSPLRRRIEVNANVISDLLLEALVSPEDFRGVRDDRGNLQAGAIVIDMDDHLFVEYLVTAPWNVTQDSPLSVKKAATALMAQLALESDTNGHFGRILLYAIPDAIEFYQKIGFIETGEGSPNAPEMELTIAAARRLINRQT